MAKYKMLNGVKVQLTDTEEAIVDAEAKAWNDDTPNRRMTELRRQRDVLLVETDWMANSDVTMSTAWKNYRQALRDLPANQTPSDTNLSNITWPTEP